MFEQMLFESVMMLVIFGGIPLIVGSLICWHAPLKRRWRLLFAGVVAMAVGGIVVHSFQRYDERVQYYRGEIQRLRDQYPFESLESRLPPPPKRSTGWWTLPAPSRDRLFEFERANVFSDSRDREERLKKLHEGSVEEFVRREGFGVARMIGGYAESRLANHGQQSISVPQPSSHHAEPRKEVELNREPKQRDSATFLSLHFRNTLHFANVTGFGLVQDRSKVAGFYPHQFNEVAEEKPWKLQRLELVGLLRQDIPCVYVTDELPRMGSMSEAPTRPLDVFEMAGLRKLEAGEDLFLCEVREGVRMLGAIRSVEQCLKCHGGQRGDLLGAFSYSLIRTAEP